MARPLISERLLCCAVVALLLHLLLFWLRLPAGPGLPAARFSVSLLPPPRAPAVVPPRAPAIPPELPAAPSPAAMPALMPAAPATDSSAAVAAAPALALDRYYTASELDTLAQPLAEIDLEQVVDETAPLQIAVYINDSGQVDQVEVLQGDATAESSRQVMARFAAARFSPALRQGVAVKSLKRIQIVPSFF